MINEFTDLVVWQIGHETVLLVYKLVGKFPKTETYALVDQLKRAVVSITSNIAEGFGRKTYKDKVHFYYLSLGSLMEVKNQLIIAKDLGFISVDDFTKLLGKLMDVQRLLLGLIAKTKTFK
ncbi:MAG: four helix bundle protein [Candidatus Shapirobacteria bacterium]|jgi:four helix bundle protein